MLQMSGGKLETRHSPWKEDVPLDIDTSQSPRLACMIMQLRNVFYAVEAIETSDRISRSILLMQQIEQAAIVFMLS